ncbi:hypothetical protein AM2010_1137 [Pelagerythrobacter marensis]|uniref:Uncharacterized protein n=1 Tax=Pelagerythrobacter marensis TaxID=543877 RepID=A0A0G3X7N8_9SPHN|nr:hypothetical protein AM2010_1137 [Pelagerythrobacter marensis]
MAEWAAHTPEAIIPDRETGKPAASTPGQPKIA